MEKSEQSESEDDIRRISSEDSRRVSVAPHGGIALDDKWMEADASRHSGLSEKLLREELDADPSNRRLDIIYDNDGNEFLVNAYNFTFNNLQRLFDVVPAETKQMLSSEHALEEFKKAKLTLTSVNGSSTVTVLENGDIVNIINYSEDESSKIKRFATKALDIATADGGIKMDNYNRTQTFNVINLTWLYSKSGFIPVSATPYNSEFVNESIREDFTAKNQGEPIVFMRYSGKNEPTFESYEQIQDYVHSVVKVFDEWDDAQKMRGDYE